MDGEQRTMGVNVQDAVYEGIWHSQTLIPKFRPPDPDGDSLSDAIVELSGGQRIALEIDERLLGGQSSSLAERIHDSYSQELEPKERGLLDRAAEQFGRRFSGEE